MAEKKRDDLAVFAVRAVRAGGVRCLQCGGEFAPEEERVAVESAGEYAVSYHRRCWPHGTELRVGLREVYLSSEVVASS